MTKILRREHVERSAVWECIDIWSQVENGVLFSEACRRSIIEVVTAVRTRETALSISPRSVRLGEGVPLSNPFAVKGIRQDDGFDGGVIGLQMGGHLTGIYVYIGGL